MKKKIKLFCIPYAGGSANFYNTWKPELAEDIVLCPIELAGRGSRIGERHYENLDAAVNDIYNRIAEDIVKYDYAIFGHSMGALLTYELVQKIKVLGLREPMHVFFSGRRPPHIPRKEKWAQLSTPEFQEKIIFLGGTPPEFFEHPEFNKIFMPLLRSDFSLSETIVDRPEIIPLNSNISILLGEDEGITPEVASQWQDHTRKSCHIHYIEGNHFFLSDHTKEVVDIIDANLVQQNLEVLV